MRKDDDVEITVCPICKGDQFHHYILGNQVFWCAYSPGDGVSR